MLDWKKKYSFGISITSMAIALISIGLTLFSVYDREWDSVMFAVAMLSGLIVVLVGWNIYTAFDSKREIDKMRSELDNIIKAADTLNKHNRATTYSSIRDFFETLAPNSYQYLYYTLLSVSNLAKYGDIETASRIAEQLDKELSNGLGSDSSELQKRNLAMMIPNMMEFNDTIIRIKDKILRL